MIPASVAATAFRSTSSSTRARWKRTRLNRTCVTLGVVRRGRSGSAAAGGGAGDRRNHRDADPACAARAGAAGADRRVVGGDQGSVDKAEGCRGEDGPTARAGTAARAVSRPIGRPRPRLTGVEPTVPPPVVQERRPPAAPEARPPSRPIAPPPLFAVPKPSVSPSAQGTATRAAPPFAGPPRPMPRPAPPAPAASEIAPVERPVSPAADRVTTPASSRSKPPRPIPRGDSGGNAAGDGASAVALPPDFHDEAMRWQRRRRIGFAVAAASFLAVIVLVHRSRTRKRQRTSAGRQRRVRWWRRRRYPPAPTNGDVIPALPAAVDSLSGALLFYREVEQDHRGGLVGCRVLDKAYVLVGRARTRVDSARGQVAGPLVAADSIRVCDVERRVHARRADLSAVRLRRVS